ncbi:hypothetical protein WCU79_00895 [Pectobacterium versatile]|uniref:Uncharacterized protein n=1 Tax=Pectobacterium versatile TaxID=2488639 RepID=A0ABU8JRN6_9GAMM|nr:hypothetical protein [Pectobacterium versatile]
MGRTSGAKNIVSFQDRNLVETTDTLAIRHLTKRPEQTPLEQFKSLLSHQKNYLAWIDSRHKELQGIKKKLSPGIRGPKDDIYKKYRWYSEQTTLLEAINGFEVFYKTTFIALAKSLRRYIPTSQLKGMVDAKVLWAAEGQVSFAALIFEHQLYHDFEKIDEASNMLVKKRRYSPNDIKSSLRPRLLALQAIFQIRHTISHNQGLVTQSDKAKLISLGYEANIGEVIDPSKNHLGHSVRDLLLKEADDFTKWLLDNCATYLKERHEKNEIKLEKKLKKRIERKIGESDELNKLTWQ